MPDSTSQQQAAVAWRIFFERTRVLLWPRQVPTHPPTPRLTPEDDRLRRLDRTRDLLEQTRSSLVQHGWITGAWFGVTSPGAVGPRRATPAEAFRLLHAPSKVAAGCLVGTILQLVENQDTAPSIADAWSCVDELYEAMHEQLGHGSASVGRIYSHDQRRAHLRALTSWNDEPERRVEDVLELLDRAISRTIVGACVPG
ncbi:hypothetical protein [Microlunatus sp. Gsoil 973]|uniref:DUF6197 family protein n=1 Tax=Microlunatus sp. Gsoil 973 TaxID=2672569 RepID=UPI0012B4B14A|nr:hypothetical protein [Microlunatus sp. Gsoil 973]QGN33416.1 hypothetical protein GJV80_12015 [Microlunatus sp. Gsoil 973]